MKKETTIPFDWLRQQLLPILQENGFNQFTDSFNTPVPVSIRINPEKFSNSVNLEPVVWCKNGYYLPERPSFTHDPLFHAGAYYVQEASSMFVDFVVREFLQRNPTCTHPLVLDTCAAPGGKTTLLSAAVGSHGIVVANEVIKKRFQILEENVVKWGAGNIIPVSEDVSAFPNLPLSFDVVLVDAPCSGEGLWRKDPDAITEWSKENVDMCSIRQQKILEHAWKCVNPGGWLIYSTCTFNTLENENNHNWLLQQVQDAESIKLSVPQDWKISEIKTQSGFVYRFFPHATKGEGFFITVFKKAGEIQSKPLTVSARAKMFMDAPDYASVFNREMSWWRNADGIVCAAQPHVANGVASIHSYMPSAKAFEVYNEAEKSFSANISWRKDLNHSFFPVLSLNATEAMGFLMCDTSKVKPVISERQPHLVTYNGLALGFIRKIGNSVRIDYPKNWRILKQGEARSIL